MTFFILYNDFATTESDMIYIVFIRGLLYLNTLISEPSKMPLLNCFT